MKKMSPQLLVADIDRSIEFYTKQLGFDLDFCYQDFYAGIIKDGYSIHLTLGKSFAERANRKNNEDVDIIFLVNCIEGLYDELSNRSVAFIQSLRGMPYGKEFYVADPDSYIITFLEEA